MSKFIKVRIARVQHVHGNVNIVGYFWHSQWWICIGICEEGFKDCARANDTSQLGFAQLQMNATCEVYSWLISITCLYEVLRLRKLLLCKDKDLL